MTTGTIFLTSSDFLMNLLFNHLKFMGLFIQFALTSCVKRDAERHTYNHYECYDTPSRAGDNHSERLIKRVPDISRMERETSVSYLFE